MNNKTFYTYSLGCKVNSYECSSIASLLKEAGYKEDRINPYIIIINTCSVTHVADQKSRQHIRKFKKDYPKSIIFVMGCYSQGNADYVLNECNADIVIGTTNRSKILELIKEYEINHKKIKLVDLDIAKFKYDEFPVTSYSENIRAYLKIQDGCNNFCSYCLIPYRRGISRSRDFDSIIKEANELVSKGYKEIILTGIHIGLYGKDINRSFTDLVEELLKIKDLYRLRISSLEESEIDDKLIDLLRNNDKLAKHLHIPLQSGCDETLKRMKRKYDTKSFYNKISYIKEKIPNICLTSDVIVGFPGESEEEFIQTYEFINHVGFNMLHVFPYSRRSGTLADSFINQVKEEDKKCRSKKLLELSNRLWKEYNERFKNQKLPIIVESVDKEGNIVGHTSNYLEVKRNIPNIKVGDIIEILL